MTLSHEVILLTIALALIIATVILLTRNYISLIFWLIDKIIAARYQYHHFPNRSPSKMPAGTSLLMTAEKFWRDLPVGGVLYNPPQEMDMGIEEIIEVRVTNKLTEHFKKELKGKGEPQIENIKVSPKMKAQLDGDNAFDIKKRFDDPTMAIVGDYTQWEWDVTPLKSGIQKLKLYLTGIIEIEGRSDRAVSYPALVREIKIKVNYKYKTKKFCEKHWKFVIGTIISVLALIVAYLNLNKPA